MKLTKEEPGEDGVPIETDDALRKLLERVRSIAVVGIKAGATLRVSADC
jgi:hypothetical protein